MLLFGNKMSDMVVLVNIYIKIASLGVHLLFTTQQPSVSYDLQKAAFGDFHKQKPELPWSIMAMCHLCLWQSWQSKDLFDVNFKHS